MNDNELMSVIRRYAKTANDVHRCRDHDGRNRYAGGTPPVQYRQKLIAVAAQEGFRMKPSICPRQHGPGCDGHTVGYIPPLERYQHEQHTICIVPDLYPAQEFAVMSHELAHAILRHPPRDWKDDVLRQQYQSPQDRELSPAERQAHLAAIGACTSAGLTVGQDSLCYLAERVQHGSRITQDDQLAAFHAARIIAKGL
jgi:hypothetical protein